MPIRISVDSSNVDLLRPLHAWLIDEDELRGRVALEAARPGATELGTVTDTIIVALGAGGTGTVLASSLVTWIKTRRSTVRITVRTPQRTIAVELATIDDIAPVLRQVLEAAGDE